MRNAVSSKQKTSQAQRRFSLSDSRFRAERGFTLVEMIVAVALFAIVMIICIGALLSLVTANRKAQGLQSVMNNLNVAIDGMVRSVREGTNYRCGSPSETNPDCPTGGTVIYFTPNSRHCTGPCADWMYEFHDGRLWRSQTGSSVDEVPITTPEVTIDSITFYVLGATRGNGDTVQPKVLFVIKGTAGTSADSRASFHLQATAVQRVLDI